MVLRPTAGLRPDGGSAERRGRRATRPVQQIRAPFRVWGEVAVSRRMYVCMYILTSYVGKHPQWSKASR